MDWLDQKYLNLFSPRLEQYARKGDRYDFRCPYCGDSATSKRKARAGTYEKEGRTRIHCFNCDIDKSFDLFLKDQDPSLHTMYRRERMEQFGAPRRRLEKVVSAPKKAVAETRPDGVFRGLKRVVDLPIDHPARKYVVSRRLEKAFVETLYLAPKFYAWVNSLIPDKFSKDMIEKRDEPRIIIPFKDKNEKIHAFQGRCLPGATTLKYVTILLDEGVPKIFGLDNVDFSQDTYVFEGPIDASFIPNSIATAGGDIVATVREITDQVKNLIIVYDNESRSPETKAKMEKAVKAGFRVCIWPSSVTEKDVNEMVLDGLSPLDVKKIIDSSTSSGLTAKLALANWTKAGTRSRKYA